MEHGKGIIFRKKLIALALALCLLIGIFVWPGLLHSDAAGPANEFRGVWVASVFSLNYPSKATTDAEQLKQDAIRILDNAKDQGFTAVIFQVRPSSDALYQSEIFPWSKYLTGTQGTAPANGFDPLEFMVTEAHKRGLELHAWINPYRITAVAADNAGLSANHPAKLHPEWTVTHASDGKMYWNPGIPEVRQLIINGVNEIVKNYDVDGIQIDDYFYPDSSFEDAETYAAYGQGFSDLADWRRDNNDQLVKALYDTVHNSGKNTVFGVSPFGIWQNQKNSSLGSATSGKEAYSAMYADTRGWVKKGYVDYIAPQIYWNIGYSIADYAVLADWWAEVTEGTGVDLYIGMAAYRSGDADSGSAWAGVDEIRRQVERNRKDPRISGSIMYSYAIFAENAQMRTLMKELNGNGNDGAANPGTDQNGNGQNEQPGGVNGSFADLNGHWAAAQINYMAEKGIIKGDDQGRALPDNPVKRADFVLMLLRMLEIENVENAENFTDVPADAYYARQLATAKQIGLVGGIGDNRFGPEELVTRQDMFVMTYRALEKMDKLAREKGDASVLSAFGDNTSVADYAQEAMIYFVNQKIVNGNDKGLLTPLQTASRAEAATILANLLKGVE